jgi:hypothetical protein
MYQPARPAGQVNASVITAQMFPDQFLTTQPALLPVAGSGRLEQIRFRVRASGSATTIAATTSFLVSLYVGQSLTVASNALLKALTATVINNTTASWYLEALLLFDSISGNLTGQVGGMINNAIIASTAITPVAGLNGSSGPLGTEPVCNLCVGATFGVNASPSNVGRMAMFVLDT